MKSHFCSFVIICVLVPQVGRAAIRPSFYLSDSAWNATDIVMADEGETIDGNLTVRESFWGDLKIGQSLHLPQLAVFEKAENRTLGSFAGEAEELIIDGRAVILFLRKSPRSEDWWGYSALWSTTEPADKPEKRDWYPAAQHGDLDVSMAWISGGQVYVRQQVINPGPVMLWKAGPVEEFRRDLNHVLGARMALRYAESLEDPARRAGALAGLANSTLWPARTDSLAALGTLGKQALPLLQQLLQAHPHNPERVVAAIFEAAGDQGVAEMVTIIKWNVGFFRSEADKLALGWWNKYDGPSSHLEELHNRYSSLNQALRKLETAPDLRGLEAGQIREVLELWQSKPALHEISGVEESCTKVLQKLPAATAPASPSNTKSE